MQLMSMGENKFYYLLRWDDNVLDIREQFPLNLKDTLKISEDLHVRHPKNKSTRMTSDFLVDYTDGSQKVFSVKYSRNDLDDRRTSENSKSKPDTGKNTMFLLKLYFLKTWMLIL